MTKTTELIAELRRVIEISDSYHRRIHERSLAEIEYMRALLRNINVNTECETEGKLRIIYKITREFHA